MEQALLDFSVQQKPISNIRTNAPKSVFSSKMKTEETKRKQSKNTKQSPEHSVSEKRIQMRKKKATIAAKTNFTVTFPDGTIIHGKTAAETLAKTINLIGPQIVAELPVRAGGGKLVSQEGSSKYSNYRLDDGFIMISHSSTDDKIRSLKKISKELGLRLIINKTPKLV